MTKSVRVGVIGLGSRWRRRYLPALLALRDRFRVSAVHGQVEQQALAEARRLGCAAVRGLTPLLESDDVEAVLLLDPQWYGLWPIELACRLGKPVFCAAGLLADEAHADALHQRIQESRLPVMVELLPRLAPVTARLRELLAERLGPARMIVAACGRGAAGPGLLGEGGPALLDWCATVMGGPPVGVQAMAAKAAVSMSLEFADGQTAQITGQQAACVPPLLHVIAERGSATVELPNRLRWQDKEGRHTLTLRQPQASGRMLLERFHQMLQQGTAAEPGWEDAYRALGWLRAAAASLVEGKRSISSSPPHPGSSLPGR